MNKYRYTATYQWRNNKQGFEAITVHGTKDAVNETDIWRYLLQEATNRNDGWLLNHKILKYKNEAGVTSWSEVQRGQIHSTELESTPLAIIPHRPATTPKVELSKVEALSIYCTKYKSPCTYKEDIHHVPCSYPSSWLLLRIQPRDE